MVGLAVALAAVMVLSAFVALGQTNGGNSAGLSKSGSQPPSATKAPSSPNFGSFVVGPNQVLPGSIPGGKAGATLSYSANWAGFAVVPTAGDGSIEEVMAEWYTPTVSCASAPSGGAVEVMWVGIDGYSDSTVEQVGTLSYCSTTGATPQYYSWWEFAPYNDIQEVNTIGGGNFVAAYVLFNPGECYASACGVYTLVFHDLDAGISWAVTGYPNVCNSNGCEGGVDDSAECISEAPTGFGYSGFADLADYGTATFYECAGEVSGHFLGIGGLGNYGTTYRIEELDSGAHLMQTTSGLSSYYFGNSVFTTTWKRYS